MRYMGGKSKIQRPISRIINENRKEGQTFISLFLGAGSVEQFIKYPKILNDKHKYLMAMHQAIKDGTFEFPEYISEEEWRYWKEHKDENPALAGFVGFACSFGGRWFEGYARDRQSNRNFALEGKKNILKKIKNGLLDGAILTCKDYTQYIGVKDCIIYADPPYKNTKGYPLTGDFNHDEFWENMREMSKDNLIFISESNCPEDFKIIYNKQYTVCLDKNPKDKYRRELLVVHESNLNKLTKEYYNY